MVTMSRLVTYDHWGVVVEAFGSDTSLKVFFVAFIFCGSLLFFNLCIGIILSVSFTVATKDHEYRKSTNVLEKVEALQKIEEMMVEEAQVCIHKMIKFKIMFSKVASENLKTLFW